MRRRLAASIAAVAAIAVALFALPLAIVLEHSYRDEELLRLQRDTVAAAREIDLGNALADPVEFPDSRDGYAVYDVTGRRVAADRRGAPRVADPIVRDVLRTSRPGVRHPPDALVAAVPLLSGERVTGVVRARRSAGAVARRTHQAWLALAAAVLGLAVLATFAAIVLGRRLAAPLELVASTARRLGDGDFSVRAPHSPVAEVDAVAVAVNTTAARLGGLIARERAFTANASHQLRTPLAALRLNLESTQLLDTPADVTGAINQIDRLEQTIETLLAVASDAPRIAVDTELGAVIAELEGRWREPLAGAGRPLRTDLDAAARRATVTVQPTVLSEVLDVLLDNAHRHGKGAVTVTARALPDWWALDVHDEGEGISEGDGPLGAQPSPAGHHGIGLPLARTLIEAEGGRLIITNSGPGPIFTVLLHAGGDSAR